MTSPSPAGSADNSFDRTSDEFVNVDDTVWMWNAWYGWFSLANNLVNRGQGTMRFYFSNTRTYDTAEIDPIHLPVRSWHNRDRDNNRAGAANPTSTTEPPRTNTTPDVGPVGAAVPGENDTASSVGPVGASFAWDTQSNHSWSGDGYGWYKWNSYGSNHKDDYHKDKDGDIPEWDGKSSHRTTYFRKIDIWEATTGVPGESEV